MIVITGRRLMGRVEEHEGTFIVTQFVHLNYVPLVPLRSFLVLESDVGRARLVGATGIRRCVELKLYPASVLAGYLRVWGTMGTLFCVIGALIGGGDTSTFAFLLFSALLGGVTLWSWAKLGRLGAEAIAQRRAYAALTHEQVDPALLCRNNDAFRTTLHANVAQGAQSMMGTGYRTSLDPRTEWARVALDPTVHDREFLQACLTLARIEWGRATGGVRTLLAAQHKQIWQKLRGMEPQRLA
jgi:hypothetical protein